MKLERHQECFSDCIEGPPTCGCLCRHIDALRQALYDIKDRLDQGTETPSCETTDECWRIAAEAVDAGYLT